MSGPGTNLVWAIALAALSSAALRCQQPANVVRESKHFRIEVHPQKVTPDLAVIFADAALAAAESAWPVVAKVLDVKTAKVTTIRLYCDFSMFRAVEQSAGMSKFQLTAFSDLTALEGHVLLWPQLSEQVLLSIGLPSPTRQNIILAAARQVAAQQLTAELADPWLYEVIALGVLETLVNPKHAPGIDTAYDTRRQIVVEYPDAPGRRPVKDFGARLYEWAKTSDDWQAMVAHAAVLAQHLGALDATWAKKMLPTMRKRKSSHMAKWRNEALESVVGGQTLGTQVRFEKLCRGLRPVWREEVPMMQLQGKRWFCVGSEGPQANISAAAPPPNGDYAIRAAVELTAVGGEQNFRFMIDWSDTEQLCVILMPNQVRLGLWNKRVAVFEELLEVKAPIATGTPFDLAIEVTKEVVQIVIDGTPVGSIPSQGGNLHKQWGLGSGDTLVWLEGLRIEPLAGPKK